MAKSKEWKTKKDLLRTMKRREQGKERREDGAGGALQNGVETDAKKKSSSS